MAGGIEAMSLADARYSRVAIWLHWIIAVLILANLFLGFFHESFGEAAEAPMMITHMSVGVIVLGLSLLRFLWRLGHWPPPFDPVLKGWEVFLARLTHALFYVLMILLPLSGWAIVSTGDRPVPFLGLFAIAALPVARGREAHDAFEEWHELLALVMIALILLHVAGALKHHLQGHRHLTGRMAPWVLRRS